MARRWRTCGPLALAPAGPACPIPLATGALRAVHRQHVVFAGGAGLADRRARGRRDVRSHDPAHALLLDLVPILFILSLTKGLMRPATRRVTLIERRAGFIAHPVFAVFLYVGMMGFWHVPRMYDLALAHGNIHVLEHICFVTAGSLYWWHLLSPIRSRLALGGMGPIVYMAVTKFFVGVLGIILVFAPHAIYPWYEDHPHYWGLTARVDQNVAGGLMALEQSVIMGIALVYIIYRMLSDSEKEAVRQERHDAAWASYRRQLAEHKAGRAS